jgi:hypothetical protein
MEETPGDSALAPTMASRVSAARLVLLRRWLHRLMLASRRRPPRRMLRGVGLARLVLCGGSLPRCLLAGGPTMHAPRRPPQSCSVTDASAPSAAAQRLAPPPPALRRRPRGRLPELVTGAAPSSRRGGRRSPVEDYVWWTNSREQITDKGRHAPPLRGHAIFFRESPRAAAQKETRAALVRIFSH